MELKQFDAYTNEEIEELLSHWFYYYGTEVYTMAEFDQFKKIVKKEPKKAFELAAILCHRGIGSTPVLDALRGNKTLVEALIKNYEDFSNTTKMFLQRDFIEEVVNT
ncbi:MAG: hypothetical protein K2L98_03615, partial [Bacilli bacterium]|nr:hypothetical protein [Bacilli bacterium]